MIELWIVADAGGFLAARARREEVTRRQLEGLGVPGPIGRRCEGCGASDHGALWIAGGAASRSRSRGWHAFAAADRPTRLGLDIEHLTRAGGARRAAPLFTGHNDECGGPAPIALRTFTRKEAIVKARGVGLHADLRRQPTALSAQEADGWRATLDGWWLIEDNVGPVLICIASEHPQAVTITVVA